MTRLQRSLAAWTIAAAIVAGYLAFGRIGHFLDYGFAGYFAILLINRPSLRNLAASGCAAVALAALLGRPAWSEAPEALSLALAYLGVGAAIVLAARSWWDSDSVRLLAVGCCVPALMIAGASVMLGGNTPPLLDNNLLRMDEILFGVHPSFMLGRLAANFPGLHILLQVAYQLLALALTAALALACRYPARLSVKSALAILLYPAALSEFVYLLCPAAGPKYVYAFPFGEPEHALTGAIHQTAAINATPSLHITWALLLFFAAMRIDRRVAIGGFALVVLTILATLGLGEHYVVDLLAAVPFTLLVACSMAERWHDAAFGLATVVIWQLCARVLPAGPILLPFALLPLVAISVYRLSRLVGTQPEGQTRGLRHSSKVLARATR